MAIILEANKVNLFVSSVLFVFWYHSPNSLDTPRNSQSSGQDWKADDPKYKAGVITVHLRWSEINIIESTRVKK
jgi:hypothetical protein